MRDMSAICPVCHSGNSKAFPAPFTFIRHQDFMPMRSQPSELWKCDFCQAIYLYEQNAPSEIEEMYRGAEYARKKKTEHVVFEPGGGENTSLRTTYFCLADSIEKIVHASSVDQDSLRFLDIGCFDGKLLLELNRRFPHAAMHGFDVSDYIAELFPKASNFSYFSCDLEAIDNRYDVIVIANVLCYVNDLPALMENIDRLLQPDGSVFFVCTDIERNPYFLTCGDQYTFQTPINLRNSWHHFGYTVEYTLDHSRFPRSILGVARRRGKREELVYEQDNTLPEALRYLDHAAKKLLRIASDYKRENPSGRIVVLGCTNNAAWVHNLAGGYISCFTDENPNRIGIQFYQKDVIHPRQLVKDDLLIIPYAETSVALADKFDHLYKAKTFSI